MKKTKVKKIKKLTTRQLQDKLWIECRRLVDILHKGQNGTYTCFTCGKPISGSNKHLGHFIPSSTCGAYLRYDLRNLRWQCMNCNVWGGGQGAVFYKNLVEIEGQQYVDILFKEKNKIIKAYDYWLELLEKYKAK